MEEWSSPVYAFFVPVPEIVYMNGQRAHEFQCLAKRCKQKIQWFLDTGDKKSTSNLHRHVKSCWGLDTFNTISEAKNIVAVQVAMKSYAANGTITTAFIQKKKGKVTYSTRPHMKEETWWVVSGIASIGGLMWMSSLLALRLCAGSLKIWGRLRWSTTTAFSLSWWLDDLCITYLTQGL